MSYLSLYRKYRPQRFEDVVGQEPVVRTLQNALRRGRVAHAYMFSGPRGTGKTSLARLLAKGLNCRQGPTPEPCNVCSNCRLISDGYSMDVVEIDGASNRGIDEIRDLRENVKFAPTEGGYKVYIIDEVHMLTTDAFNALLKTLEEPPEYVVFVLATTEPHKVPKTIASRCQHFQFHNFTTEQVVMRLQQVAAAEGLDVEPAALSLIGRHAAGGMRDALAILDQAVSFQGNRIEERHIAELLDVVPEEQIGKLLNHIAGGERLAALTLLQEIIGGGADVQQLTKDCISFLRELMLARTGKIGAAQQQAALDAAGGQWPNLSSLPMERILGLIDVLAGALADMRWVSPIWLPLEMAVIRGCGEYPQEATRQAAVVQETVISELRERIQRLEKLMASLLAAQGVPGEGEKADVLVDALGDGVKPKAAEQQPTSSGKGTQRTAIPSSAADRAVEFQDLLARWGEIAERLRQERQAPVEAFLRESKPLGFDEDGRLVLVFPRVKEFHKVSLEQPRNKEVLQRVLSHIAERPVEVVCYFEDEIDQTNGFVQTAGNALGEEQPSKGSDVIAPERPASDAGNPALEAALRIFGGTVQEVRCEAERG